MLVGFLACLSATTVVSLAATITSIGASLESRVKNVELPAVIAAVTADIRRHISEPLTSALDFAANHFLIKWEYSGQPGNGFQDFVDYASGLKKRHDASSVYWISEFNRAHLTDSGSLGELKPEDVWFDQFLSRGKAFELGLGRDSASKQLTLFVNARFNAGPGHNGLAGMGLPMTNLAKQLEEYKVGESGSVIIVGADGVVLVHKDSSVADGRHRLLDLPGFGEATVSTLLGAHEAVAYAVDQWDGREITSASIFIPDLNVYVVVRVPTSELTSALKRTAWTGPLLAAAISIPLALVMVTLLARTVARPIQRAASMLNEISDGHGDLTKRMLVESGDEVGQLATSFNRFMESLHSMIKQVRESAAHVASASSQLAAGSQDLSERTEQASSALQQTAATIAGITGQVQSIVASTSSVAELARGAQNVATRGNDSMLEVEQTMSGIDRSSQSVAEIIGVIDEIAFQTNILALNASVESARAGPHGRGFAVVAAEVRALAGRAGESAQEVRELISAAKREAQMGREQTAAAKNTMSHILRSVSELSGYAEDISINTQRQSAGISEVDAAVRDIDRATQQNACLVEEVSATAASLREHAEVLSQSVSKFKLASTVMR